ncbi:ELMO/CED-12 family-domain-containing protein [Lipomyces oligophaga]|uniref:ELMO/CED-12 family-domain-containing protein n=1 Tax=Lipomyces oligophaga TaxID=45792 RepID=UPI0034CE3974
MRFLLLLAQAASDSLTRYLVFLKQTLEADSDANLGTKTMSRHIVGGVSRTTAVNVGKQSSMRVFAATVLLSLYKIWKGILHRIYRNSMVERLARFGYGSFVRSQTPGAQGYYSWLSRRAVWLVDAELILSDQLQEDHRTLIRYTSVPEMGRLELARSVALSICRKKEIPISPGGTNLFTFLVYALSDILLVDTMIANVTSLCRHKVEWSEYTVSLPLGFGESVKQATLTVREMFEQSWDSVHAAPSWPKSSNRASVSRESKSGHNWVTLGFQGVDPSDDIRGTGMFGLLCFHHYTTRYATRAAHDIYQSRSPEIHIDTIRTPWYPSALASIHVSSYIASLCFNGTLRLWLICSLLPPPPLSTDKDTIYKLYDQQESIAWDLLLDLHSYILIEFHSFWVKSVELGRVRTIMDFDKCFQIFTNKMTATFNARPVSWTSMYPFLCAFPNIHYYFSRREYVFANLPYGIRGFKAYFAEIDFIDQQRLDQLAELADPFQQEDEEDTLSQYEMDSFTDREKLKTS